MEKGGHFKNAQCGRPFRMVSSSHEFYGITCKPAGKTKFILKPKDLIISILMWQPAIGSGTISNTTRVRKEMEKGH